MKLKVQIETMPDEWKNNGALREFFIDYSSDMLDASETIETLSRKIAIKSYIALLELRGTRIRKNRFKRNKPHQFSEVHRRTESDKVHQSSEVHSSTKSDKPQQSSEVHRRTESEVQ